MLRGLSAGRVVIVGALILGQPGLSGNSWGQEPGQEIYQTYCAACHSIGGGRLVGPDVLGVHDRRAQDWLEQFVRSSQTLIKSGDAEAVALFEEYNGLVMPDAVISDAQIKEVLAYIKTASTAPSVAAGEIPDEATAVVGAGPMDIAETPAPGSQEDIEKGRAMFQGTTRFESGGAACNACHDVRDDAVTGGGILAAELTTVFSRMGGPGIKAILVQAPFPVMQAAYADKPLTDEEATALVAFLEYADAEESRQSPKNYGVRLFLGGTGGAAVLFVFFGIVWRGRKIGSVNQEIYDRQASSSIEDRPS